MSMSKQINTKSPLYKAYMDRMAALVVKETAPLPTSEVEAAAQRHDIVLAERDALDTYDELIAYGEM